MCVCARARTPYDILTYLPKQHTRARVRTRTCTRAHTHKRTHVHTRAHTCTYRHTDTQTHRHVDTQTHRHTDTQTHRHTDAQTHRHTDTQTRTHMHVHRQTCTHTHTRFPRPRTFLVLAFVLAVKSILLLMKHAPQLQATRNSTEGWHPCYNKKKKKVDCPNNKKRKAARERQRQRQRLRHWFHYSLKLLLNPEQETTRSKHIEFAAVRLPRCLVCIHKRVASCVTVWQCVYFFIFSARIRASRCSWHALMYCSRWHAMMYCSRWHAMMYCSRWHAMMYCSRWHAMMYCSIATSIPTGRSTCDTMPLKMHCCPSDGDWRWAASKRRGCNSSVAEPSFIFSRLIKRTIILWIAK